MASNFDSYYLQDGCWNCKYVHCKPLGSLGDEFTYHCNFNKTMPVPGDKDISEDLFKWLHEYTVDENGICNEHIEEE